MGLALSVHRKGTPTDELLESLRKKLEERYCVMILDEVDKLEDDRILYDLVGLRKACLILISNSESALHGADPRVRSRLASSESIGFPSYSERDILDILRDRAEWGMLPGAIKEAQLSRIASSSEGDSRVAISTLRIVAEDAERQDFGNVTDSLIEKALPRAVSSSAERSMGMLSPHQRLIMDILEKESRLESGELWRRFCSLAQQKNLGKVSDRMFRNYMDRLSRLGLVDSQGKARWRTYSLKDPGKH
jgi:Cdc6-like AAA superfamily ATPase